MDKTFISIGKAAEKLGVSNSTLRVWEEKGILIPERTPTGHRRYRTSQIEHFLSSQEVNQTPSETFLYARVSTQKQANDGNLDRQVGRLTAFALSQHLSIHSVFTDVASGLNEKRKGLQKLLLAVKKQANSIVLIEYKDRLARFGFSYLQQYIQDFGGRMIIVEEQEKDEQQELVEDLIAITTSFSARIYGKRGGRVAKRIETILLKEGESVENNDSSFSLSGQ